MGRAQPAGEGLAGAPVPPRPAGGGVTRLRLPTLTTRFFYDSPTEHHPKHPISRRDAESSLGLYLFGGEAAAGRTVPPPPTRTPEHIYKPRPLPARPGGAPKCATNRRPSLKRHTVRPTNGPSRPQGHRGPEPGTLRRNRPRAPRSEAPGRPRSPCPPLGPAPAGRTRGRGPGIRPRRELTSPRRRAWAAAALRLAVVEAGAGSGEGPVPKSSTAPGQSAPHRRSAAAAASASKMAAREAGPSSLPIPVRGSLGRPL